MTFPASHHAGGARLRRCGDWSGCYRRDSSRHGRGRRRCGGPSRRRGPRCWDGSRRWGRSGGRPRASRGSRRSRRCRDRCLWLDRCACGCHGSGDGCRLPSCLRGPTTDKSDCHQEGCCDIPHRCGLSRQSLRRRATAFLRLAHRSVHVPVPPGRDPPTVAGARSGVCASYRVSTAKSLSVFKSPTIVTHRDYARLWLTKAGPSTALRRATGGGYASESQADRDTRPWAHLLRTRSPNEGRRPRHCGLRRDQVCARLHDEAASRTAWQRRGVRLAVLRPAQDVCEPNHLADGDLLAPALLNVTVTRRIACGYGRHRAPDQRQQGGAANNENRARASPVPTASIARRVLSFVV